MSFKLVSHLWPDLPPQAWLCFIEPQRPMVTLWHGRNVAVADTWFFEGAWSGDFTKGDFDKAQTVAGSGLKIDGERVILVPPSHVLEGLYYKPFKGGRVLASNSLSFLLAGTQDRFPPIGRQSWGLLSDIRFGVSFYNRTIPTMKGRIRRTYWHQIMVHKDGYKERPIPAPPAFDNYRDYVQFLKDELRQLLNNGANRSRIQSYAPLLTLSSGYDSTGIAALTKDLGCTRAIGITSGRTYFGADSDSGIEVAQYLNLNYEEFDRDAYKKRDDAIEAIFLACGVSGEDFILSAFENRLTNAMLLTGVHGDLIWSKPMARLGHEPGFSGISGAGTSISEYRLTHGFIHIPVPYIGSQDLHQIQRISNTDEMAPYSIGGDYDRPIPRRLAEEAGVPRTAFGHKKNAISQPLARRDYQMSDASEADFAAYIQNHDHEIPKGGKIKRLAWNSLDKLLAHFEWRLDDMTEGQRRLVYSVRAKLQARKPLSSSKSLLHRWAFDKRIAIYTQILSDHKWHSPSSKPRTNRP